MSDKMHQGNLWKMTSIGLFVVVATALVTGVVVARYAGGERRLNVAAEYDDTESQQRVPAEQEPLGSSAPGQAVPGSYEDPNPVPPTPRGERRERVAQGGKRPSRAIIRDCNRYANSHRSRT